MSFNIIATELFERKLKRLAKKHKSLKSDLLEVIYQLEENPTLGTPIGKACYTIRIAIASKGIKEKRRCKNDNLYSRTKKHGLFNGYLR